MDSINGYPLPPEEIEAPFATGKREVRLLAMMTAISILLVNFVLYGGFYLGFAVVSACGIIAAAVYLLRCGCKPDGYSAALLVLSLGICGSFARSNDSFVKLVMVCFLGVSANLGLCLLAGQNRRDPGKADSLLDAPRAAFSLGFGKIGPAFRGLNETRKNMDANGKNRSAVFVGFLIAVPVLAVLIPLLVSADAAFEGLLNLLPRMDISEPVASVILGLFAACVVYTRAVALAKSEKKAAEEKKRKKMHPLTVNTVLGMVCLLYMVYLFSQLAYISGGLAGILPEEFTMAEYARRGFFEMVWLCAINLALITGAVALTGEKESGTLRRILCLIIGVVTLFLVATAVAKMVMYIDSYGLTRLRVLTTVIMVFLAVTTVIVSLWLILPKLHYMKWIVITGLLIGGITAWVDVDTVVAAYNVRAYQAGQLETVDIHHLCSLSDGAIPYIEELALSGREDAITIHARQHLEDRGQKVKDLRNWSIAGAKADCITDKWD